MGISCDNEFKIIRIVTDSCLSFGYCLVAGMACSVCEEMPYARVFRIQGRVPLL